MGATMGYAALSAVKSGKLPLPVKVAVLALCCALAVTANWNYIAVLWVVGFGLFYGNFRKQAVCFCVVGVLFHLIPTFFDFGLVHEGYPHPGAVQREAREKDEGRRVVLLCLLPGPPIGAVPGETAVTGHPPPLKGAAFL